MAVVSIIVLELQQRETQMEAVHNAPSRHTTWRQTPADLAAVEAIADALRREGVNQFPTRAAALRYALHATAVVLRETGQLPALTAGEGI